MVRLKTILEDYKFGQSTAKEMNKVLQEKYMNGERNLLYRSDTVKEYYWTEKEIRKDRKPLNTANWIDAVIAGLEKYHFPNTPRRRESKFALTTSERDKLKMYGGRNYICFPHEKANVMSLDEDSFVAYFRDAKKNLENAVSKWSMKKDEIDLPDIIEDFLVIFWEEWYEEGGLSKEDASFSRTVKFVSKNWKKLREQSKEVNDGASKIERRIGSRIYRSFRDINKYFKDMQPGVVEGSQEVIFDGPTYLIVEPDFFQEYFEWKNGSWQLNQSKI